MQVRDKSPLHLSNALCARVRVVPVSAATRRPGTWALLARVVHMLAGPRRRAVLARSNLSAPHWRVPSSAELSAPSLPKHGQTRCPL